jgi:hypothetical protein
MTGGAVKVGAGVGISVIGISVRVDTGVMAGETVLLGVKVGDSVTPSATAVGVSLMSEVPEFELSDRIMPNVSASASVPITTIAAINSLLRSRRRAIG